MENEYRPLNYWGWLENIKPEEVRWQIREMHRAGLGGYVMHARGGLEIPYMGKEWLDSVAAMADEGKQLGMTTVIDDEDGWPSGFGAGEVNGKGADYWLKWLQFELVKVSELKTSHRTVGVYIADADGAYAGIDASQLSDSGQKALHIYYNYNRYYVDNLNPAVVQEFIRVSYKKYYDEFPTEFGSGIRSIFSDEPQLARQYIPWSLILPYEFEKSFGYSLIDVLPAVFFPSGDYKKTRYDFWSTVNRLFTDSYGRQIGEWCGKHGIAMSGHVVYEDFLGLQMLGSGGAMPFYEHMQVPGIDWLCRTGVNSMIVKQVASVAEQTGKKRILSEMFGCVGWNVSFEELKWIGERHYVLGVNQMLQHLGLYSLKGSRKREYPASLFYQQPWWKEYHHFNDYFTGLSKIMSESRPQIDLLVIHPLKSAWIAFEGQAMEKIGWERLWDIERHVSNPEMEYFEDVKKVDSEFKALTTSLLELNYDFHYGDETLMGKYGSVEGDRIKVGQCTYRIAILPSSVTLDRSTLKLLKEFAGRGGKILSVGQFPGLLEGIPSEEVKNFQRQVMSVPNAKADIGKALSDFLVPPVSVCIRNSKENQADENKHVYCTVRKSGDEHYYYIVNTSLELSYDLQIKLQRKGPVFRLNPASGVRQPVKMQEYVHLEPAESLLLVQPIKENQQESGIPGDGICSGPAVPAALEEATACTELALPVDELWDIGDHDMNSITLDYCRYSIDEGEWQPELPVIRLQQKMVSLGRPADVKMLFRFYAVEAIETPLYIVLEEPEKFRIRINGDEVVQVDRGWWVDKSFRKLDITGRIRTGWNEILLSRHFFCSEKVYRILGTQGVHEAEVNRLRYHTELESIYLLGDFKVELDNIPQYMDKRALMVDGGFRLAPMTGGTRLQDLITGGFPFFAGRIALTKKIALQRPDAGHRVILKLNRPDAIVTKVYANGKLVKTFTWAPYSVDITDEIADGENEITMELVNSLRNLLGPHHHAEGELYAVGPHSFNEEPMWTDRYCFVRFGIG